MNLLIQALGVITLTALIMAGVVHIHKTIINKRKENNNDSV